MNITNRGGSVGFEDLLVLLNAWGPFLRGSGAADIDSHGIVGLSDLVELPSNWGSEPWSREVMRNPA